MLAGASNSTNYFYNALKSEFDIYKVLITDNPSKKQIINRRIKKFGYLHVINQLFFQVFAIKTLKFISNKKIKLKIKNLKLDNTQIPSEKIINVGQANSHKNIEILNEINPDIIIVNGTSIISTKVLNSTNAIFINIHVGITPEYRGVHGGYWALRNKDSNNFGVTVHLIDKGIDTGSIIYQDVTEVSKSDNFLTYPLIQFALAIPLVKKTLNDIKEDSLKSYKKSNVPSNLYYHPTLSGYLYGYIFKGVK